MNNEFLRIKSFEAAAKEREEREMRSLHSRLLMDQAYIELAIEERKKKNLINSEGKKNTTKE